MASPLFGKQEVQALQSGKERLHSPPLTILTIPPIDATPSRWAESGDAHRPAFTTKRSGRRKVAKSRPIADNELTLQAGRLESPHDS